MTDTAAMRFDLHVISSWITPGSRVLDLGCGRGDLLFYLQNQKQVRGVGIELDEENAAFCIARGLSVLHGDFIEEVADYPENHFDYIVLSQTLQQVYNPEKLLTVLLSVGSRVIVSFPNFSHWRVRLQFLLTGAAPRNEQFPYEWHNTPNIRIITLKDFRIFVRRIQGTILKKVAISSHHHETQGRIVRRFPNWRSTYGIFLISDGTSQLAGQTRGPAGQQKKLYFSGGTLVESAKQEAPHEPAAGLLNKQRELCAKNTPDINCL